ncbi:NAD(P)-dependent oxidoreductase [Salinarimonas sp.]|uniref:NAD-dependent epimerase/dehydratase family protein n=1 Tax=Salinarimonas sp. TaxID=2766526 RepID=UPI0032D8C6BF
MSGILVTGAGGFLGGALTRALLARGDAVVDLEAGDRRGLDALAARAPLLAVEAADICDGEAVDAILARHRPRAVVHCAAIVGVVASLEAPARLLRVNIEGTANLLEAMARHGTRRMIHISSEEIYGAFQAERIDEEHPVAPLYAYGVSKAAVEQLGRSYRATHGLDCIDIRTSWVYGPGFPRDRVPVNLVRAAARGEALHLPCGAESRIDHTYLDDAVAGVIGALDLAEHPFDAYHVASDSAPSLAEIAAILRELAPGADLSVGPGEYRHAGRIPMPRKGALSCARAADAFGYRPRFDIRAGLAATLEAERRAFDNAREGALQHG